MSSPCLSGLVKSVLVNWLIGMCPVKSTRLVSNASCALGHWQGGFGKRQDHKWPLPKSAKRKELLCRCACLLCSNLPSFVQCFHLKSGLLLCFALLCFQMCLSRSMSLLHLTTTKRLLAARTFALLFL